MTENELEAEWARARIEAMADGSLEGADARRMRAAMASDAELAAAVETARRLRAELRTLGREPLPDGLTQRLLAIPSHAGSRLRWHLPGAAAAAGVVVALTSLLVLEQASRPPSPRDAAIEDFRIAMTYLQHSAAVTGEDVAREVSNGLRNALVVSHNAMLDGDTESSDGDRNDDQE